ncbi:hypothetical protein AWH69_00905 [Janibacter melonis]|uniref:Uncharacterized protein n=1 Tax=Janibacter melonis TaxID=262209 RepID=A0A176QF39_9MICO|nr:glycosyltransferase [Janibacter melonis]OAB88405.1 hypothetical protein AWH69_00905 [Janibacter melonis]
MKTTRETYDAIGRRVRPLAAAARRAAMDVSEARTNSREVDRLRTRLASVGHGDDAVQDPPVVYGVTRYSVFRPGGEGWLLARGGKADPQEYMRRLWAPERMDPREHIFLSWAVPIYQQFHESHGYRHVVQYSPEMPTERVEALRDAAATYPVLALVPKGTWQDRVGWMAEDVKDRRIRRGPAAWLRVDDDDLLARTYLDRLVPYVTEAHDGWAISFSSGITAEYDQGRLSQVGVSTRPLVSMGQAFVGRVDHGRLVWPTTVSHVKAPQKMPTILDSREPAYLRLLHDHQDRNAHGEVDNPTAAYDPALVAVLRDLFPTVADHVGTVDDAPGS